MISVAIAMDAKGNRVLIAKHESGNDSRVILQENGAVDLDKVAAALTEAYSLGALDHLTEG